MYNSYFWSNYDLSFLTVVESVQVLTFRSSSLNVTQQVPKRVRSNNPLLLKLNKIKIMLHSTTHIYVNKNLCLSGCVWPSSTVQTNDLEFRPSWTNNCGWFETITKGPCVLYKPNSKFFNLMYYFYVLKYKKTSNIEHKYYRKQWFRVLC